MNIIEAIKSEKPFKRKNTPTFLGVRDNDNGARLILAEINDAWISSEITLEHLLADDWEVKDD